MSSVAPALDRWRRLLSFSSNSVLRRRIENTTRWLTKGDSLGQAHFIAELFGLQRDNQEESTSPRFKRAFSKVHNGTTRSHCPAQSLFYQQPRIFYMHVMGHGSPVDVAERVKPALDRMGSGSPPSAVPPTLSAPSLDTAAISNIVGKPGEQNGAFRSALDQLGKSTNRNAVSR